MLWRGGGFRAKIAGMNFRSLGVAKMNCSFVIEWHLLPKIWYFLLGKIVSSQPSTWTNSILRDDGKGIPAVILVHATCGLLRWKLMGEGVFFVRLRLWFVFTSFLMSLTIGQRTRVPTTHTATALRSRPPIPSTTVTPSTTKTAKTTARTTATTTTTTAKRQRQRHVVLLQILTVYSSPIPGRPKVFARHSQAIDQYLTEGRVGNGGCDPAADLMSICWVWWWIAWFVSFHPENGGRLPCWICWAFFSDGVLKNHLSEGCSVWLPHQLAVLDSRWWVINYPKHLDDLHGHDWLVKILIILIIILKINLILLLLVSPRHHYQ